MKELFYNVKFYKVIQNILHKNESSINVR